MEGDAEADIVAVTGVAQRFWLAGVSSEYVVLDGDEGESSSVYGTLATS